MESVSKTIESITDHAQNAGFNLSVFGKSGRWPLIAINRKPKEGCGKNIYISTGMHGDEPAGPQAVLELLREDRLPATHNYWICPVLNPAGLDTGKRENLEGIDLNRDYEARESIEIQAHTRWAHDTLSKIDLGLLLHEDWESTGFYVYEAKNEGVSSFATQMLRAVQAHLPIDKATEIDGWPAENGLIDVAKLPQEQVGTAESGFFSIHFGSQNYTMEAPSSFPLEQRVEALKAAVLSVLDEA